MSLYDTARIWRDIVAETRCSWCGVNRGEPCRRTNRQGGGGKLMKDDGHQERLDLFWQTHEMADYRNKEET